MARASLLPSVIVHVVVIVAALFLRPCAAQSRAANISAVEAAVRDRAFQLLRGAGQLVDACPSRRTSPAQSSRPHRRQLVVAIEISCII